VLATPDAKQPIAIIIPHEANLRRVLKAHEIDASSDLAQLCTNTTVKDIIRTECNNVGKRNGFKPMELLQAVVLTSMEWTPHNGLVTAAQKIQRSKISKTYRTEIDVGVSVIFVFFSSPYLLIVFRRLTSMVNSNDELIIQQMHSRLNFDIHDYRR